MSFCSALQLPRSTLLSFPSFVSFCSHHQGHSLLQNLPGYETFHWSMVDLWGINSSKCWPFLSQELRIASIRDAHFHTRCWNYYLLSQWHWGEMLSTVISNLHFYDGLGYWTVSKYCLTICIWTFNMSILSSSWHL